MIRADGDEQRWAQLMAAAQGGDKRAYERLLQELATVIEQYVQRRFGTLSFREDCVQECLLALHRGRLTYDPKRPFRPWFFAIVRNRVVDLLRNPYVGREAPPTAVIDNRTHPDPSDELAAGEILTQLEPAHRDALTLTKILGYSLSEAAAHSGISESAMKSRVSRAVRAAETLLQLERIGD